MSLTLKGNPGFRTYYHVSEFTIKACKWGLACTWPRCSEFAYMTLCLKDQNAESFARSSVLKSGTAS